MSGVSLMFAGNTTRVKEKADYNTMEKYYEAVSLKITPGFVWNESKISLFAILFSKSR